MVAERSVVCRRFMVT